VAVSGPAAAYRWEAEPDLVPTARLLAAREGIFAPFPGLGPSPGGEPFTVVLVRDLACLEPWGVANPGVDWVAGLASYRERVAAVRVEHAAPRVAEVATVLRHELAHLALAAATGDRAPRWLQEGYAQRVTGAWNWDEAWRLRWTFLRSGARLRTLSLRFPADPQGASLAYQLSYTAVDALWDLAGERGFEAFVRRLGEGESTEGAFRLVFGITESGFEERWTSRVKSRYGLLYTITRTAFFWLGLAVLVIWAHRRRRRAQRERIEAMRAAEAGEPEVLWRAVDGPPERL
jgi:hypothetical protein